MLRESVWMYESISSLFICRAFMRNGKPNKSEDRGEVQGQGCHNKSHVSRSTARCLWCCNIKLLCPQSPLLLRSSPKTHPCTWSLEWTHHHHAPSLSIFLSHSLYLVLIILSFILLPSLLWCPWALPVSILICWWVAHTRGRSSSGTTAATGEPQSREHRSQQLHIL